MSQVNEEYKAMFKSIDKKLDQVATKQDVGLILKELKKIKGDIVKFASKVLTRDEVKRLHSAKDVAVPPLI